MSAIVPLPDNLAEVFQYLDDLRESGETNMYGASNYLREDFDMDRREALAALSAWMHTFNRHVSAAETYRGWTISQGRWPEPKYTALSPNYDASWEGEEDGWRDNGEKADAETYDALIEEIDNWFEENGPFGAGA